MINKDMAIRYLPLVDRHPDFIFPVIVPYFVLLIGMNKFVTVGILVIDENKKYAALHTVIPPFFPGPGFDR
jgi:hypothetical protein